MAVNPEIFDDVSPFSGDLPVPVAETGGALVEAAVQREIAEVQAAMAIAKKFPRNQKQAFDRIMLACQRPSLAEEALYSYSRGGTEITGPSIRLAEAIVQQWGNADFGIKEVDQRNGESTVLAYAWDLETNTRQTKTFQVKHKRYTRKGTYSLEDPRDIYEMVANQGARRLRACILGIIPGDIVDAAKEQCETTLKTKADTNPETIKRMVEKFGEYRVSKAQIEKRIQRNLESITAAQIIGLKKIFNSLKDGMSKAGDWFEEVVEAEPEKKERKKPGPKPKEAVSEPPQEPKDPGPGESTSSPNGKPGESIVDRDSAEEIKLYCAKLGLNVEAKVEEYSKDKTREVRAMDKDDAGKLLGWLMDQAADKGLI